jgi:hypothetical protein
VLTALEASLPLTTLDEIVVVVDAPDTLVAEDSLVGDDDEMDDDEDDEEEAVEASVVVGTPIGPVSVVTGTGCSGRGCRSVTTRNEKDM